MAEMQCSTCPDKKRSQTKNGQLHDEQYIILKRGGKELPARHMLIARHQTPLIIS
jgi:hypothetical protein